MKSPISISIPSPLPHHPWHPSVVSIPEGWNGHRFWMAQTPFPPFQVAPYKDRWELPCIHFSDDGIHWQNITANPIDNLSEEQIASHSYHSDPHLVLKDNVLYCYYRLMENHDTTTTILRKYSKDGIHWSKREIIEVLWDDDLSTNREIISPAIVWIGSKWRLYFVDDTFTNLHRGIQFAESDDGIHYKTLGSVWKQQEVKPWHIDIQLIGGKYNLLVHDVDNNQLVLYESINGTQFDKKQHILKASRKITDYWSNKLYRACLTEVTGEKLIYFSASDGMSSHIGLMKQKHDGKYVIVDCLSGLEKAKFVSIFVLKRFLQYSMRCINFISKRIKK